MTFDPANLAVAVDGAGTAQLTWDPSTDPGRLDYSVVRRTPSTGAVFVPGVDTPVASGLVVPSYADAGLASARYDWQVLARLFSPSDVAGLAGEWDASVASSIHATGGFVDQLDDLSGNGFHLAATGSARPATGAASQNGLNVLSFDGSNDILENAAISVSAGNTGTWLAVINVDSASGNFNRIVSLLDSPATEDYDNPGSIVALYHNTNVFHTYWNNNDIGPTTASDDAAHVMVARRNGGAFANWVDGSAGALSGGLATNNFAFSVLGVGGDPFTPNAFCKMKLCHLLWYNAAVSTGDRQALEAFLKAKWGTP